MITVASFRSSNQALIIIIIIIIIIIYMWFLSTKLSHLTHLEHLFLNDTLYNHTHLHLLTILTTPHNPTLKGKVSLQRKNFYLLFFFFPLYIYKNPQRVSTSATVKNGT